MPKKKPETTTPGPSPETIVKKEIDSALSAFRASDFEARLRGRIRAQSERPGRTRRPGRRLVLAWAGLILILVSGVSIGVLIRSRAHRTGLVFGTIETVLARSPLFRPTASDEPAVSAPRSASLGPFAEALAGVFRPQLQRPVSPENGEPSALRTVSEEELDRNIGELIKGHELELFFSEYLKKKEDV